MIPRGRQNLSSRSCIHTGDLVVIAHWIVVSNLTARDSKGLGVMAPLASLSE